MTLAIAALPLSFVVSILWAPWLIGRLRDLRFGKQIRSEEPDAHQAKRGTPTMGGWLMVITPAVLSLVFIPDLTTVAPLLLASLLFAIVGAIDDYANMKSREGLGLRVRYKFIWHTGLAAIVALAIMRVAGQQGVIVPGLGAIDLGWWYLPFAVLVIFATVAAVNETDGLDGLAGGVSAIAFAAYGIIALHQGWNGLGMFCLATVGALLAFLWFNVNPARVFMGDTGALALGAALATVALLSGWVLVLPLIGSILVAETLSVMLQIAYFKRTGGRRIFRMSPLHYHFELGGWPEQQIVFRFWLVAAVGAAIGVAIALA